MSSQLIPHAPPHKSAGRCALFTLGTRQLFWQSSGQLARNHRLRELCGRSLSLRWRWSEAESAYVERIPSPSLGLLLEGRWRAEELRALSQAGWGQLFFPHEGEKIRRWLEAGLG